MPRLPGVSGSSARILRPISVRWLGLGKHVGAPGLHQDAAVGLLVVADAHHVDRRTHVEDRAGHGQRAAPLARAGLGGDALDALHLVVVGLRDGGVGLVAAGRADALVLVVDVRRGVERLLQFARRGTPAWAGRACRRRGPRRGSRSSGSALISCASRPIGKIGAMSSGPMGWRVPGCSGGSSGRGRSGAMLYHASGMYFWSRCTILLPFSAIVPPYLTTPSFYSSYMRGQYKKPRLSRCSAAAGLCVCPLTRCREDSHHRGGCATPTRCSSSCRPGKRSFLLQRPSSLSYRCK